MKKELDVMKDDSVQLFAKELMTENESGSMWGVGLLTLIVIPIGIIAIVWQAI